MFRVKCFIYVILTRQEWTLIISDHKNLTSVTPETSFTNIYEFMEGPHII